MRYALAVFLIAHGIAHLPGFLVLWKLKTFPELPYKTTLLGGLLDVGDIGTRIMGSLFLLGALAFAAAGLSIWMNLPSGKALAFSVTFFSLILTALAWPEARVGLFVNLVLLGIFWRYP